MSPGVGNRIRRLSHHDRLLLLLPLVWSICGFIDNYLRLGSVAYLTSGFQLLLMSGLWASVVAALAWSTTRQQRRLADYGFTFKRGGLVSLAVLLTIHAYLTLTGKLVPSVPEGSLWVVMAMGAFMEEIVYRVMTIDAFVLLLDQVKGKAFWAILASSVLFSAGHIPSKAPMQLQGLFISSLILGYTYYKTRSVLLPAWFHAATNAGFAAGMFAVILYCAAAAADLRVSRSRPDVL